MLPSVTNQQKTEVLELDVYPLWTVNEVARYLRLNPETVRQMARLATIPAIKMGRSWRFRSSEIKAWVLVKEGKFQESNTHPVISSD